MHSEAYRHGTVRGLTAPAIGARAGLCTEIGAPNAVRRKSAAQPFNTEGELSSQVSGSPRLDVPFAPVPDSMRVMQPRRGQPGSRESQPVDIEGRFRRDFSSYHDDVLRYAIRRCGDRQMAEDVAAETFLKYWRSMDVAPDDPLPWLLSTARGLLANQRRALRRFYSLLDRMRREVPVACAPESELDHELLRALARLSENDREVLLLTGWDGLDRTRGAMVVGCSEAAFAARLRRARVRLHDELQSGSAPSHSRGDFEVQQHARGEVIS